MSRSMSWYTLRVMATAGALTAKQRADYKPGTAIKQARRAERAKFATASEITHSGEKERIKAGARTPLWRDE